MKTIALILILLALFYLAIYPLPFPEFRMCANCGGSCGITLHTFWLKWDDAETYTDNGAQVTEVPMYAMCSVCGYSMYEEHVRVKEKANNAD